MPTPGCCHVDAFTYDWNSTVPYCFPPSSLYLKCLDHIRTARVHKAYFIVPWHPTTVVSHVKHAGQRSHVPTKKHRKEIILAFPQFKHDRTRPTQKFKASFRPFVREIMTRNGTSGNVAQ